MLAGGWARSPAVRSVKLARLGPFDHPTVTEAGARGAALLAGVAAGRFAGIQDLPAPSGAAPGPRRPLVATPDSPRERSPW